LVFPEGLGEGGSNQISLLGKGRDIFWNYMHSETFDNLQLDVIP